jgi:hypothetical protein
LQWGRVYGKGREVLPQEVLMSSLGRLLSAVLLLLLSPSVDLAQERGIGYNEWAETSKTAFRVKLSGFINTHPDEQTLRAGEHSQGVATLRVGAYNQIYQFEIVYAQALDNPQVSARMILQQLHKYAVDFEVTGPRDLLLKMGLAEPGTPLTLIGFFRQYNRTLMLQAVETIGTREQ